jgi:hypothetical protein
MVDAGKRHGGRPVTVGTSEMRDNGKIKENKK